MNDVVAYLGLGTNLGQRSENLAKALDVLSSDPGLHVERCSRVYETEPWGVADQPPFLNMVAGVTTSLDPESLLALCKEVEQQLGRQPGIRWGPRPIDVDILLYGDSVVQLPHLEIPHPRLHIRAFALVPLAELAPGAVHPGLGKTIGELAATVDDLEGVKPVAEHS